VCSGLATSLQALDSRQIAATANNEVTDGISGIQYMYVISVVSGLSTNLTLADADIRAHKF